MSEFAITVELLEKFGAREDKINWLEDNYNGNATLSQLKSGKIQPDYDYISWLISECEECQIEEWLEYYKSLNPDYEDISWLIAFCEYCQTIEMLEYYMSFNPDYEDVSWLISECKYCQTDAANEILLADKIENNYVNDVLIKTLSKTNELLHEIINENDKLLYVLNNFINKLEQNKDCNE